MGSFALEIRWMAKFISYVSDIKLTYHKKLKSDPMIIPHVTFGCASRIWTSSCHWEEK